MKPATTWIAIADGARARVVKNAGPGKGLEALEDMIFEGDHASSSEIMADRPGRTFDSTGNARHALERSSDPHEELKVQFLKAVSEALLSRVNEYDRLILVAPPRVLGLIRKSLPSQVARKVTSELGKDLTQLPNADLPSHLEQVLEL